MNKIKILLWGLAACQLFSVGLASAQEGGTFDDTDFYQWENSVNYLEEQGVVEGYSDGTFKPDKNINRAEFTKIIMGGRFADDLNNSYSQNCFSDVQAHEWYAQYICLAKAKGIVDGYPDGTFKPSQNIQQAEALKIVLIAFGQNIDDAGGDWFQKYLRTAETIGMLYFATNNPAGYQITRGEMAYFTAWLMGKEQGEPADQIVNVTDHGQFTYIVDGTTHVVKMSTAEVKMRVLSGHDSIRPKNSDKCSLQGDCVAESQAESFSSFVGRSHKEVIINGSFFDAYSIPLDGINYHQIASDIVMNGDMQSMLGSPQAFGNGGMLAQSFNGDYKFYFPVREWVNDSDDIHFAISNYPYILDSGHVRTKDEIGIIEKNDEKFWVPSRRGGLGISADGSTIYYVSTSGTVEDLANKMLQYGASDGFALDAGGSNGFFFNGKTIFSPGRNLTTVIEFYRYK